MESGLVFRVPTGLQMQDYSGEWLMFGEGGEEWVIRKRDEVEAFGGIVSPDGSSASCLAHGMRCGEKSFHASSSALLNKRGSLGRRCRAWACGPAASVLWSAGTWAMSQDLLRQLRAWENRKFKSLLHWRPDPEEGWQANNRRLCNRVDKLMERTGCQRLAARWACAGIGC